MEREVSCIGLGGMPMSIAGRPEEAQSIAVVHAALNAGIDFIDTADVYCLDDSDIGHNERLIAKAVGGASRNGVLIATKGGLERPNGDWTTNGTPQHLRQACERSLQALGVETIDLYQLHAPDSKVPFSDSVGALADLQKEGKIRHIGLSNVEVSEIEVARAIVEVVSVQNRCNLFDTHSFESGVVAYCDRHSIGFLPHSPVGGHRGHVRLGEHNELMNMAKRLAASPYEISLAYLLTLTPVMIPIPGASRTASILSSARAGTLTLPEAESERLRALFPKVKL